MIMKNRARILELLSDFRKGAGDAPEIFNRLENLFNEDFVERQPADKLLDCMRVLADGFEKSSEFWRTTEQDPHNISTAMYASLSECRNICEKAVERAKSF